MAEYTKREIEEAQKEEQKRLPKQVKDNNDLAAQKPALEQTAGAQLSQKPSVKPHPTLAEAAQFNTAVDRTVNAAETDPNVNPTAKPVPELQPAPRPTNTPKLER